MMIRSDRVVAILAVSGTLALFLHQHKIGVGCMAAVAVITFSELIRDRPRRK